MIFGSCFVHGWIFRCYYVSSKGELALEQRLRACTVCLICCFIIARQPIFRSRCECSNLAWFYSFVFQQSLDLIFQWTMRHDFYYIAVWVQTNFKVEAEFRVVESSAQVWLFGTRCLRLMGWRQFLQCILLCNLFLGLGIIRLWMLSYGRER